MQFQQYKVLCSSQATTDTVNGAIAYAFLQRHMFQNGCKAITPSQMRPITKFCLEKFAVEEPQYTTSLSPTPEDIKREQLVSMSMNDSVARALQLFNMYKVRMIPCYNEVKQAVGIITFHDLVKAFMDSGELTSVETNVEQVLSTLRGTAQNIETSQSSGPKCSYASTPGNRNKMLHNYKIYNVACDLQAFVHLFETYSAPDWANTAFISTAHAHDINSYICDHDAGMLIVCSAAPSCNTEEVSNSDEPYVAARQIIETYRVDDRPNFTPIIFTAKSIAEATMLIKQSTPVHRYMNSDPNLFVKHNMLLEDIAVRLNKQKDLPGVIIVNEAGNLVNVITRHDTGLKNITNLVLVGTSDLHTIHGLQAPGVSVTCIIDNHKLSRFETSEPIEYYIRPFASVCTIVAGIYDEKKVIPPLEIAGILLSGILGATQLLKSPRTTQQDAKTVEQLAQICGIDPVSHGDRMIKQLSLNWDFDQIFARDSRVVTMTQGRIFLCSIEVKTFDQLEPGYLRGMEDAMMQLVEAKAYCGVFCLIVDVPQMKSLMMVVGQPGFTQRFGKASKLSRWQGTENVFETGNIVSRRLQLMPLVQQSIAVMDCVE